MLITKGYCTHRLGYTSGQGVMRLELGSRCLLREQAELDQVHTDRWQHTAILPQGASETYTEMPDVCTEQLANSCDQAQSTPPASEAIASHSRDQGARDMRTFKSEELAQATVGRESVPSHASPC